MGTALRPNLRQIPNGVNVPEVIAPVGLDDDG
jgi:hypothetical protein